MIAGGVGTAGVLAAALGTRVMPELALGLAGPLVSAVVSWQILERTQPVGARAAHERDDHVVCRQGCALWRCISCVILKVLALRPMPFMLSFTGYYVALHVVEAVYLKRLLANGVSS